MRAMPAIWSHDAGTIQEALRLTAEAIGLDETYALPRALGAWCYAQRIAYLHSSNPAEDRIAARSGWWRPLQCCYDHPSLDGSGRRSSPPSSRGTLSSIRELGISVNDSTAALQLKLAQLTQELEFARSRDAAKTYENARLR